MSFCNVFINFHSDEPNEDSLSCINHNMFLTRHLHVVIYSYWTVVLHFSSSISMTFLLLKVYRWNIYGYKQKSFQDSYSSSEIFQRHFHFLKSLSNNISYLTVMFWRILSVLIRLPMIFIRPGKSFAEVCPSSRMFSVWKSLTKSTSHLEKSFDDKFSSWKIFTRLISVLTSLSTVSFRLSKELSRRRSSFKYFSRREVVIKRFIKTKNNLQKTFQNGK